MGATRDDITYVLGRPYFRPYHPYLSITIIHQRHHQVGSWRVPWGPSPFGPTVSSLDDSSYLEADGQIICAIGKSDMSSDNG